MLLFFLLFYFIIQQQFFFQFPERLTEDRITEITKSSESLQNFIIDLNEKYPDSPYLRVPRRSKRNSSVAERGQKRKRSSAGFVSPETHYKQKSIMDFLQIGDFVPPFDVSGGGVRRSETPKDFIDRDFDKCSVVSDCSTSSSTLNTTSSSSGYGSTAKRMKFTKPPPNKNNEYVVENILSVETKGAVPLFQVKWLGYPNSQNTWEPLENLRNTNLLETFLDKKLNELREYLDELVLEMLDDVTFNLPNDATEWRKLKKEIDALDEIQLQSDLIVLTMIKVYDNSRFPKRMYGRAKTNLITKHYKDLRKEQMQKIEDWTKMVNEKEPGSKIQVINDVDFDVPPEDFVYVNSNVPGEGVTIPDTPDVFCNCTNGCNYKSDCCGKLMDSQFAYRTKNHTMCLRIPMGVPIYECNSKCACPPDCPNRIVQQGRKHKLNIFKTPDGRGWGVRTEKYIPEGQFICEYTGEVITFEEAEKRGLEYDAAGRTYLFDLDFYNADNNYTIDALHYGNIARFINHSCDPNCGIWALWSECQDPNFQKIVFFSLRPIATGEELTIDYLNGQIIKESDETPQENPNLENQNSENVCPNVVTEDLNFGKIEEKSVLTQIMSHERFRPNSVIKKETCVCKCGSSNCRKFIF